MKKILQNRNGPSRLSLVRSIDFTRLWKRLSLDSLDDVAGLLLESRLERSERPSRALGEAALVVVFEAVKSVAELRSITKTRTVVESRLATELWSVAEAIEVAHSVVERSVAELLSVAELTIEVGGELLSTAEPRSTAERSLAAELAASLDSALLGVVVGVRQCEDSVFDLRVQNQLLVQRIELALQRIMWVLLQFAADQINLNRKRRAD